MRTLVNEIEVDICTEVYKNACRAVGTAGTTPFGSNFDLLADLRKIFADNGQPVDDGQWAVVMNTSAGANLRKLATLQKANEAGGTDLCAGALCWTSKALHSKSLRRFDLIPREQAPDI